MFVLRVSTYNKSSSGWYIKRHRSTANSVQDTSLYSYDKNFNSACMLTSLTEYALRLCLCVNRSNGELVETEKFSENISEKLVFITNCAICLIKYRVIEKDGRDLKPL